VDRNLALELVRATEAAALSAARWVGKGNAVAADQAAMQALHRALSGIKFRGRIVLGEGDHDFSSLLFTDEMVGSGSNNAIDLAVDSLESTNSVAFGRANAMAVVALADQADFILPSSEYLDKIAVGAEAAGVIDLCMSVEENLERIAEAKSYSTADLTVVILDRPRHTELIERVRRTGARIHLIPDGDIAGGIAAALPGTGIDVLLGTGGTAAGVLTAAALRCIDGEMQFRVAPTDEHERDKIQKEGTFDLNHVYCSCDLVRGDNAMFAATGVTDGDLLNGVRYRSDGAATHSVVMRQASRTRRFITTEHYFSGNPKY
jgi:fructose-1,6-bisphosphatase II